MKNLGTVKKNVEKLLINYPALRDNYTKLIFAYWRTYNSIEKTVTIGQLYSVSDKLTPTESITRASRNLQRDNESLRGNRFGKTKEIEEDYKENFSHTNQH